ncbi:MAG: periplasmic heavy metal sensor [Myxococcota bacterium]
MKFFSWKKTLVLGCTAAFLGTASWAWAHGPRGVGAMGGGGPGGLGRGLHRMLRAMDLTEAQEVELVKASRPLREEGRRMMETHREQAKELARAVGENRVDGASIHASLDEMAAQRLALAHKAVDVFLSVEQTLSQEQRAQLQDKVERWLSREIR